VIGGFVCGLSMRDVESLCEEAGLGKTSKSTVATICAELHERFEAFCRRSRSTTSTWSCCSSTRSLPPGPSQRPEGGRVICAWGIDENGHRALVSVRLGARESKEDWVASSAAICLPADWGRRSGRSWLTGRPD
jgi:transposase-like protein